MLVNTATECFRFSMETKEKFDDPNKTPETYWPILDRFLHNKKIPNVPPVLVNDEVVSNFSEKVELFNSQYASQCTPIVNNSKLPSLELKPT